MIDYIKTHKIEIFGISMFVLGEITANFSCDQCRPGLPELFIGLFFVSMFGLAIKSWVLKRRESRNSKY